MSDSATNGVHTHYQEDSPADPNEEREHWKTKNDVYRHVNDGEEY